ncbi:MAG: ABC transporter ATP-binding protein [Bacillota bacterium]
MCFLKFRDINYLLGTNPVRRVTVSGAVDTGEVLVVRGPSGAGKTTLLRILARLQPCMGGEVFLQGRDWLQIPAVLWRAGVHYVPQKPVLFDGTFAENLMKPFTTKVGGGKAFDPDRARSIMGQLLLPQNLWRQDARTLSGGEAARLAFARALLINPQVLLLDEPTAALDDRAGKAFYSVLSRWLSGRDHAAVLVSHNNDYTGLDRVAIVDIEPVSEV